MMAQFKDAKQHGVLGDSKGPISSSFDFSPRPKPQQHGGTDPFVKLMLNKTCAVDTLQKPVNSNSLKTLKDLAHGAPRRDRVNSSYVTNIDDRGKAHENDVAMEIETYSRQTSTSNNSTIRTTPLNSELDGSLPGDIHETMQGFVIPVHLNPVAIPIQPEAAAIKHEPYDKASPFLNRSSIPYSPYLVEQPSLGHRKHCNDITFGSTRLNPTTGAFSAARTESNEDDFSSMLLKGVDNLRLLQLEKDQLKQANEQLQMQLDLSLNRRQEIEETLSVLKTQSREALQALKTRLDELDCELNSLKAQSSKSFSVCSEIQASLCVVEEIKNTSNECFEAHKRLIGEDGQLPYRFEIQTIIKELQLDSYNKQQVIDLLRDRLETSLGELADANSRISDLQTIQEKNSSMLEKTICEMTSTDARSHELTQQSIKLQSDYQKALSYNAELEIKLANSLNKIEAIQSQVDAMKTTVESSKTLTDDVVKLKAMLEDRENTLAVLRTEKHRLTETLGSMRDLESRFKSKDKDLSMKTKALESAQQSLAAFKAQNLERCGTLTKTEAKLTKCQSSLETEMARRNQLMAENTALTQQIDQYRNESIDMSGKMKDSLLSMAEQYKALESRFGEVSAALEGEKTSHQALLNKLQSQNTTYHRQIEDITLKYDTNNQVLEEKSRILQSQILMLEEYATKLKGATEQISTLQEQNGHEASEGKQKLRTASDELASARQELQEAKLRMSELESQMDILRKKDAPEDSFLQELSCLRETVRQLCAEKSELAERLNTIQDRYNTGNLNMIEKRLVDHIHRSARASYEQELVFKKSEIKQRENTIKELQSRIKRVEKELARTLSKATPYNPGPVQDDRLLHYLNQNSTSSQLSSDVVSQSITQAPDRDEPNTNQDDDPAPVVVLRPLTMDALNPVKGCSTQKQNLSTTNPVQHLSNDQNLIQDESDLSELDCLQEEDVPVVKRTRSTQMTGESEARPSRRQRTSRKKPNESVEAPSRGTPLAVKALTYKAKSRKRK